MPSASKTSVPLGRDPLVLIGIAMATVVPALVFGIGTADWTDWFTHPMRAERLGRTPDDTIQGVRVLRIAAVLAAIGWLAVPLALRRLRGSLPVPAPPISQLPGMTVPPVSSVSQQSFLRSVWHIY